eukprot:GEMP01005256.1.p1 GENE.GEMP01005256.1~~GEMP01005256.1.p1  ORF type:complete len:595 (+),score=103.12 GEMP01005256.1:2215-3999(+)
MYIYNIYLLSICWQIRAFLVRRKTKWFSYHSDTHTRFFLFFSYQLLEMKCVPIVLLFVKHASAAGITGVSGIDDMLASSKASKFDRDVFRTEFVITDTTTGWRPSKLYKWNDFTSAVKKAHTEGVAGLKLWLGDSTDEATRAKEAMVNLAAFLAQAMQETIRYDACSENNWDNTTSPPYLMSGACGQSGQDYARGDAYNCDYSCPLNEQMKITAVTNAVWWGAPGPFVCAPDGTKGVGKGWHWDHTSPKDCPKPRVTNVNIKTPAWDRPQCKVYDGQQAGSWRSTTESAAKSVQGCCWWGRGVIQTTGRCNFGKLNHFLGKTHLSNSGQQTIKKAPATPLYGDIDFCANPEIICQTKKYPELKWMAGLFFWMEEVQSYTSKDGTWKYMEKLKQYVADDFKGNDFIDAVSGIVNRGCWKPPCGEGLTGTHAGEKRAENFHKVLEAMELASKPNTKPTDTGTDGDSTGPDTGGGGTSTDTGGGGTDTDTGGGNEGAGTATKESTTETDTMDWTWIIVALVGGLLLIVIVVGVFVLLYKKKEEPRPVVVPPPPPSPPVQERIPSASPRGERSPDKSPRGERKPSRVPKKSKVDEKRE